jgi:hypothetical protein
MTWREKPQVDKIIDAGCLEISQVFGVVQVTLRVQVPVADFDRMIKTEFWHAHDYKA